MLDVAEQQLTECGRHLLGLNCLADLARDFVAADYVELRPGHGG